MFRYTVTPTISTILAIAREREVTMEAIANWQAQAASHGVTLQLVDIEGAWKSLNRRDVSYLFDGVDDYRLDEKLVLARHLHNSGPYQQRRALTVFLLGCRETFGLVPTHSFWLHYPSQPISDCFAHLTGTMVHEMANQFVAQ